VVERTTGLAWMIESDSIVIFLNNMQLNQEGINNDTGGLPGLGILVCGSC
jgi:hypothetical protein